MKYRVDVSRAAEKELDRIPIRTSLRIRKAMLELADKPRPPGVRKLKRTTRYRVRVGDYRIIYFVDDRQRVVTIAAVANRKDAYSL